MYNLPLSGIDLASEKRNTTDTSYVPAEYETEAAAPESLGFGVSMQVFTC